MQATIDERIKMKTDERLRSLETSSPSAMSQRADALEREWDVERAVQAKFGFMSLTGALLGSFVHRRWYLLSALELAMLLQHSLKLGSPVAAVLRRGGMRNVQEIERERYAIKAMRGDFEPLPETPSARVEAVLRAIDKR